MGTQGEVRSGRHRWRIRVDEVHNASGFTALGVVAGPKDNALVGDMDAWQQWYLYYSDDGKKELRVRLTFRSITSLIPQATSSQSSSTWTEEHWSSRRMTAAVAWRTQIW